ncbi:MAG: CoA transferase [Actinomycetia bacterium]|nr:CoA transferase [Actinomycetes bacterium]MCP5034387.1 CoA transferase [Actinomycetes bacterium]
MAENEPTQPLGGVRVVELTDGVAGAYTGRLMAVLGADVVKVEPPGGDVVRRWGPFPGDDPGEEIAEQGALHLHLNAGKRSVVADLAEPDGRALAIRLAAGADIVLESFVPGAAAVGLDAATLRAENPGLVVTSITPFGQYGPYVEKGYRGSEIVHYAMGGPMHATGVAEREPLKLAGHVVSYQCGAMAAAATMAALLVAEQSGLGVHIDIANFETQAGSIDRRLVFLQQHIYNGRIVERDPAGAQGLLPTGIYPAADAWVQIATPPPYADRLLATIGNPELAELLSDPDWVTNPDVPDLVEGALYAWLAEHTAAEAMEAAQPHHWPVTVVRTPKEVVDDDHFQGRQVFVEVNHPVAGPVLQPSAPIRFAGARPPRRPAPLLGEHDAEVRAELDTAPAAPPPMGAPAEGRRLPLEGIRVLDLTMVWAGPYTTMLLGDLGADVIRVEDARLYNGTRGAVARPPENQLDNIGWLCTYPDDKPGEHPWNRNAFFNVHARNKRSATVDLLRPEGREAFLRLVEEADLVVENNAVGVMDKLGLGWEQLHERNERLVVLRMPALGLTGPKSSYVGFGANFEALCGLTSLRGYADGDPSLTGSVYYMDAASGAAGAFAALVALRRRDRTGVGEQVELAQGENMLNVVGEYLIDAARTRRTLPPPGNRHLTDAPQGSYPCVGDDRWVVLSVDSDTVWAGLQRAMGSPVWAADERFANAAGRRGHHDELDQRLSAWTASLDRWEVTRLCQAEGVAAGPVLDDADAVNDPHLRARGFFRRNGSEEVGWHDYPSHLWHWDGPTMRHEGLCPFGAANEEVWRDVAGLDDAAMATLSDGGHLLDHYIDDAGNPL